MAPSHSRQLLALSLPTIVVILSYLWYKRKRAGAKSDPGDAVLVVEDINVKAITPNEDPIPEVIEPSTPPRKIVRSLSGVETPPINIVAKNKSRSNPVISDEDLDIEIERVRSMKNNGFNRQSSGSSPTSKTPSPPTIKEEKQSPVVESFSPVKHSVAQSPIKVASPVSEDTIVLMKVNSPAAATQTNKQRKSKKGKKAMAQKEEEKQLAGSSMMKPDEEVKVEENGRDRKESQRGSSDRDSANHSPAEVMLVASPSLSSISDNHSERSTDSGKGGSDPATPPPASTSAAAAAAAVAQPQQQQQQQQQLTVYEFLIPQQLVGKLIGRQGSFVTQIRERTGVHIVARKHPTSRKHKVCAMEGTGKNIEIALKIIREKFPIKKYPEMTLEKVEVLPAPDAVPLVADNLYLKLIEEINNDTILSCMVAPHHLFLQQPMHPTYPSLNVLTSYMNNVYADDNLPSLPNPAPENTVCVAHSVDSWYRVVTLSSDADSGTTYVKFLDFGGYAYVENGRLRQIRGDFLLLPFQAAECLLANIRPAGGEGAQWAEEAYEVVANVTKGAMIYTQVCDYTEEGIPLVLCYVVARDHLVHLNEYLVREGFAEWLPEYQQQQLEAVQQPVQAVASTSSAQQPLSIAAS